MKQTTTLIATACAVAFSFLNSANAAEDKTIVGVAAEAGMFKTLCAAVKAAGLEETLKGEGPFTVFAPTDEAFAKIPKEKLDELMKSENKEKLAAILTYHVVSGKVLAADVKSGDVKTVNGSEVAIKVEGSSVMIGKATVTKTDIPASNGVIHVIDTVLMPPMKGSKMVDKVPSPETKK